MISIDALNSQLKTNLVDIFKEPSRRSKEVYAMLQMINQQKKEE